MTRRLSGHRNEDSHETEAAESNVKIFKCKGLSVTENHEFPCANGALKLCEVCNVRNRKRQGRANGAGCSLPHACGAVAICFFRAIELRNAGVSVQRSGQCANREPKLEGKKKTENQNGIEEEIAAGQ